MLQTLLSGNLDPLGTKEKVSFWAAMMPFEAALPKTMPNYYDESSIADHNSCFLKNASYLPAVLLERNSLWLEAGG